MAQKKTPKTESQTTQVNYDTPLCNLAGIPLNDGNGPLLFKHVVVAASLELVRGLSGAEKFLRFQLAERAHAGGDDQLTRSQVEKLKALIGEACTPLVVGVAFNYLDGKPVPVPVVSSPEPSIPAAEPTSLDADEVSG